MPSRRINSVSDFLDQSTPATQSSNGDFDAWNHSDFSNLYQMEAPEPQPWGGVSPELLQSFRPLWYGSQPVLQQPQDYAAVSQEWDERASKRSRQSSDVPSHASNFSNCSSLDSYPLSNPPQQSGMEQLIKCPPTPTSPDNDQCFQPQLQQQSSTQSRHMFHKDLIASPSMIQPSITNPASPETPIIKLEPDPRPIAKPRPLSRGVAAHCAVERKYRESLNNKFEDLRRKLPSVINADTISGEDGVRPKVTKGDILSRATEYVRQTGKELKSMTEHMAIMQARVTELEKLLDCEECEAG